MPAPPRLQSLHVPPSCQGYIWGTRGELRSAWAGLGLSPDGLSFDAACQRELRLTMMLAGVTRIADINRSHLDQA